LLCNILHVYIKFNLSTFLHTNIVNRVLQMGTVRSPLLAFPQLLQVPLQVHPRYCVFEFYHRQHTLSFWYPLGKVEENSTAAENEITSREPTSHSPRFVFSVVVHYWYNIHLHTLVLLPLVSEM
jgi:hypothetical protein